MVYNELSEYPDLQDEEEELTGDETETGDEKEEELDEEDWGEGGEE